MAMTWIWTGMVVLSLVFGLFTGNLDAVADAAMDGAASAVELSVSMAGILCLWSGVMEIMNVCGLSAGLARAFRPILRRLMPQASRDEKTLAALSANVSANLLGLGNAATPLGIQAARRMARGCSGTASDELCLLVVLNTASIQLLPATIAPPPPRLAAISAAKRRCTCRRSLSRPSGQKTLGSRPGVSRSRPARRQKRGKPCKHWLFCFSAARSIPSDSKGTPPVPFPGAGDEKPPQQRVAMPKYASLTF